MKWDARDYERWRFRFALLPHYCEEGKHMFWLEWCWVKYELDYALEGDVTANPTYICEECQLLKGGQP